MILFSFIFSVVDVSYAFVSCPPRNGLINSGKALVEKIGINDGIKPVDAKTFAEQKSTTEAEINARYSGTGTFGCEDAAGNGQVIVKRNVVTTVFHTFLKDGLNCNQPRNFNKCAFVYKDGSKKVTVYAKRIVASGGCRPGEQLDPGNDWAIIELEKSLPKKFAPYKVPATALLHPGVEVDSVGKSTALNPEHIQNDQVELPQAFSSCVAIAKDTFKFWQNYQPNCPSRPGSSGAAVFTSEGGSNLAGLVLGDMKTGEICVAQVDPGSLDGPFQRNCRGTLIVPVEGKFLEALKAIR